MPRCLPRRCKRNALRSRLKLKGKSARRKPSCVSPNCCLHVLQASAARPRRRRRCVAARRALNHCVGLRSRQRHLQQRPSGCARRRRGARLGSSRTCSLRHSAQPRPPLHAAASGRRQSGRGEATLTFPCRRFRRAMPASHRRRRQLARRLPPRAGARSRLRTCEPRSGLSARRVLGSKLKKKKKHNTSDFTCSRARRQSRVRV